MPIRDYALTALVFALVPVCFVRPWIGILTWYWIGLMNPHRLTWDFAFHMPFAMMIGGATLLGMPFAKDRRPIPWDRELILMALLLAYFGFTTFFAWAPLDAWLQLEKVAKIILMTFVATMFIYGKDRIRPLMFVIVLSLGYYGFKGGVWSILTGGKEQVLGPEGSFIEGNTFISLALNMVIPLLVAVAQDEERKWVRNSLYVIAGFSAVASFFAYSRGGWLGLAVVTLFILLWQLSNKQRVVLVAALLSVFLASQTLLPQRVFTRAETLENYEDDCSANQRLMSWTVHWNVAVAYPLTGGGFEFDAAQDGRFLSYGDAKYLSCFRDATSTSAHSIYFQVLGHHGFVAFFLFIFLIAAAQLKLLRIRREAAKRDDLKWIGRYATGLQIGLIGYLVSGAFLSSAYFDLPWLYYALTVILYRDLAVKSKSPASSATPVRPTLASGTPG